jgi:hypothetical protein
LVKNPSFLVVGTQVVLQAPFLCQVFVLFRELESEIYYEELVCVSVDIKKFQHLASANWGLRGASGTIHFASDTLRAELLKI